MSIAILSVAENAECCLGLSHDEKQTSSVPLFALTLTGRVDRSNHGTALKALAAANSAMFVFASQLRPHLPELALLRTIQVSFGFSFHSDPPERVKACSHGNTYFALAA